MLPVAILYQVQQKMNVEEDELSAQTVPHDYEEPVSGCVVVYSSI